MGVRLWDAVQQHASSSRKMVKGGRDKAGREGWSEEACSLQILRSHMILSELSIRRQGEKERQQGISVLMSAVCSGGWYHHSCSSMLKTERAGISCRNAHSTLLSNGNNACLDWPLDSYMASEGSVKQAQKKKNTDRKGRVVELTNKGPERKSPHCNTLNIFLLKYLWCV